jgi:hypothetical protein
MPFVDHRWLGGMLTNFKTVKQSIKRLKEMAQMQEDGSLERMSKKEGLGIQRELREAAALARRDQGPRRPSRRDVRDRRRLPEGRDLPKRASSRFRSSAWSTRTIRRRASTT